MPSPQGPDDENASWPRHQALRRQIDSARDNAYASLGDLEAEAFIPIVMDGPLWPGQTQAWRVIRRPGGETLLATEGLSSPDIEQEEPSAGFGLELLVGTNEPLESIPGSWLMRLLQRVTNEVAGYEHLRSWLFKGPVSMEISGEDMPQALITSEGRVGVVLGVESKQLPRGFLTPAGEVRLFTVKALLPIELDFLLSYGKGGAAELAKRFAQSSDQFLSGAHRKPVV